MKKILLTSVISAVGALLTPVYAQCGCHTSDFHIWIDVDWDFWEWDCCHCYCYDVWYRPFWAWPDCCRRIVTIYYSPCGWYRYYYYTYPCWECERVYIENRWVYRRAVRLERQYSHTDMIRDLTTRRRGSGVSRVYNNDDLRFDSNHSLTRTADGTYKSNPERSKYDAHRTSTAHSGYETHSVRSSTRTTSDSRTQSGVSSKSGSTRRSK